MPGKKGFKALQQRYSRIGQLSSDNAECAKKLSELQLIYDQNVLKITNINNEIRGKSCILFSLTADITSLKCKISTLNEEIKVSEGEVEALNVVLNNTLNEKKKLVNKIAYHKQTMPAQSSVSSRKRRIQKPTGSGEITEKTKYRRIAKTFVASIAIHGGSAETKNPAIDGMINTIFSKCTALPLATKLLGMKPAVTKIIEKSVTTKTCTEYYRSEENILRSLNVYYRSNVLGKQKYMLIRSANKKKGIPNFVPYAKLSKRIREIDIGELFPIEGNLDYSTKLTEDEEEVASSSSQRKS